MTATNFLGDRENQNQVINLHCKTPSSTSSPMKNPESNKWNPIRKKFLQISKTQQASIIYKFFDFQNLIIA